MSDTKRMQQAGNNDSSKGLSDKELKERAAKNAGSDREKSDMKNSRDESSDTPQPGTERKTDVFTKAPEAELLADRSRKRTEDENRPHSS